MNRLVVFGCSISYGHGLEDCIVEGMDPGPNPSKLGWVQMLGDILGKEVVNLSLAGASNMFILNSILNFEFHPTDTVVIQWTFPERDLLFDKPDSTIMIGPWLQTDLSKEYYLVHSRYDMAMRDLMYSHYANCYLKIRGIDRVSNFIITNHSYNFTVCFDPLPSWYHVVLFPIDFNEVHIDMACDNIHPGPKSQPVIAKYIEEVLNEQN